MQLPVYEPEPRCQTVLEGSEDHYLKGSHDDTDSPSIPNVEECKEEMRIFGNLACSQDSDSEDTDAFLTPLNSSLNHLILHSRLSEETSHIYINGTETEVNCVEEGLTTTEDEVDDVKTVMPVKYDKAKNLGITPKTSKYVRIGL